MILVDKPFDAVWIFKPSVFGDERGYFFESFSESKLNTLGFNQNFVQDNESMSAKKGVLRGLHLQKPPFAQGKLVRVIKGAVLDVAVDIRKNSKTYGQHVCMEVNEENKHMVYIPVGFAHGFVTLEDNTIFQYKCTNNYSVNDEMSILWDDKDLGIDWQVENPILSAKDAVSEPFANFKSPF